jgi:hypothetical protein
MRESVRWRTRPLLPGAPATLADPELGGGGKDRDGVGRAHGLSEGQAWPLVLAWIAVGPAVARKLSIRGG